jgi:hypothetical protein
MRYDPILHNGITGVRFATFSNSYELISTIHNFRDGQIRTQNARHETFRPNL